jgi:hypothetical protein
MEVMSPELKVLSELNRFAMIFTQDLELKT